MYGITERYSMKNSDTIEQLRAELRQDLEFIHVNHAKNREMTRRIDETSSDDEYDFATCFETCTRHPS